MMVFSIITPFDIAKAAEESVEVQILATSDLHGRFYPYDYATDSAYTKGSLAHVATKVKELRAANPNTIVVDNGDTIQGNSNYVFSNEDVQPMVLAMNKIGYDTWTFGNHEFNWGVPKIQQMASKFDGTVLCGNVFDKTTGKTLGQPYKIVELKQKDGSVVKVGIIGMVTPHITTWDADKLTNYNVTNPVEETRKVADQIKDKVDALIAVVHMGENEEYGNGDSAREIAKAVPELAAIVAGHKHDEFANRKEGTTNIIEPKNGGDTLSKINIKLTKKDGKYAVANSDTDVVSSNIALKDTQPDQQLLDQLKSYHEKAVTDSRIVIGKLTGGDLAPADEVKGVPEAQIRDTALIDLINKVQLQYGKVEGAKHQVSAAAIFNAKANIKVGDITKAGTSNIYQYDNTLMTIKVNGKLLKKYMEWSVSYYNTFKPGDLTISFNENVRMYNYDMFSGVKYEVNISKDPGARIENLTYLDGTAVKEDDEIYLTVNNYRGNTTLLNKDSGLFKDDLAKVEVVYDSTNKNIEQVRDMIRVYIEKTGTITPELDNNWKLTGYSWDQAKRDTVVKLVNEGKLALPTSTDGRTPNVKAIAWSDVEKTTVSSIDILSFNDFHGTLKEDGKNIGVAKLAGEINRLKSLNPNTIVVGGGDLYQGSAMSNLTYGEPVSKFLASIGITASAIGNHEFDWGSDKIAKWAKDGNFDFLASNIYDKTTGKPVAWAKPYKVVQVGGKKIGFIGIATPETAFKTKPDLVKNFDFKDPIEKGNEWAKYLKETEKVDFVIALTHLGAFQDSKTKEITGEGAEFAKAVKGVDAVITAHTHQTVSGKVNGIPVVQGYYNGRSLAKLSISFNLDGKLLGITPSVDELYKRVDKLPVDPDVKAMFDGYNNKLKPILDEVVATTEVDLTHDRFEGLSVMGQWSTMLMAKVTGTQIGITNGGGLRRPIAKGDITVGTMYELMPFDNTLVTMELKGSDLKRVLENGIMNESVGWVQFYGVKVYYDKDAKAGNRITSMRLLDGTKVEMDKYYTVVTNDFMYDKGDNYDFTGARKVVDTGEPIRDAIIKELRNIKKVSFTFEPSLIAGQDTTKDPGNLPKTGSMVNTTTMVSFGSLVAILGAALFLNDKKRKQNEAA